MSKTSPVKCRYCGGDLQLRLEPRIVPDRKTRKWYAVQVAECRACGWSIPVGERVLPPQEQMKHPSLDKLPE